MRHGAQLNQPLLGAVKEPISKGRSSYSLVVPGKKGRSLSFVRVEPENLLVTAFKQSEKSPLDYVLRFVEFWGEAVEATVTFPWKIESASAVNLLENLMDEEVSVDGNQLRLKVNPYQIKSLCIRFSS